MRAELLDEAEWVRALESLPGYSFFATPRFVNAWIRHFAARGRPVAARIEDGVRGWRLVAFVEVPVSRFGTRALVGSPDGGYGIAGTGTVSNEYFRDLCSFLGTTRIESIELTVGPDFGQIDTPGDAVKYESTHEDAWVIDIAQGFDHWWEQQLDKRVRRQIRRSEDEGVRTTRHGVEALDAFFALYVTALQSNPSRTRAYPKAFLRDLMCAEGPGNASIYLTWHGEEAIAGGFLLRGGIDALAWIGAMDRRHALLHGNANRHVSVIRELAASGATSYNLGAAPGLPDVAAFKRKLGAQPRRYQTLTWRNRLWSRLRALHARQT